MSLFDSIEDPLCQLGNPRPGDIGPRPCSAVATHAACWAIPDTYLDGTPNVRAGSGRIECCLAHANYYAVAWVPRYPYEVGAAWIEILGGREAGMPDPSSPAPPAP